MRRSQPANPSLGSQALIPSLIALVLTASASVAQEPPVNPPLPSLGDSLSNEQIAAFAALALSGMDTEYPNKPSNVLAGPDDVRSPQQLHPAFYGCFDWHSSVHGHWMLARLLHEAPQSPSAPQIRTALNQHLTAQNITAETDYFNQPHNKSFERMYGWAWYLRLVTELHDWPDPDAQRWRDALKPLEELLVQRTTDYLPKLEFPIRTGVHPNTAFAMGQALDYARTVGNRDLEALLCQRARDYFLNDVNYPIGYEPSGEDFFSAALNEADLMRRVLPPEEFRDWFAKFLPGFATQNDTQTLSILVPVKVSDVTDGKLVHLAGLNLSRAWCLTGIATALQDNQPGKKAIESSAEEHLQAGLAYVFSGHYEGEHWLATFAVYSIRQVGDANVQPPTAPNP